MPDLSSSPEFSNSPVKRSLGGPQRNNSRLHKVKKPYARPTSMVNSSTKSSEDMAPAASRGMSRSDSDSGLLGGLKNAFSRWFSGGAETQTNGGREEGSTSTSKRGKNLSPPKGERQSKRLRGIPAAYDGDGNDSDGFRVPILPAPTSKNRSANSSSLYSSNPSGGWNDPPVSIGNGRGLARSSTERGSLATRLNGSPTPSLTRGLKRSGTLLDLQSTAPSRSSGLRNSVTPYDEQQAERFGLAQRAVSPVAGSPARHLGSSSRMDADSSDREGPFGMPSRSPFSSIPRSRSLLNARAPSRAFSVMRGSPLKVRSSTPLDVGHEHQEALGDDLMLGNRRGGSSMSQTPVPSLGGIRLSEDRNGQRLTPIRSSASLNFIQDESPMESLSEFEQEHKTEAERILEALSQMRASAPSTSQFSMPTSYSSRSLRRKINVPVPAPRSAISSSSLGPTLPLKLKRDGEPLGSSAMISPYARRRPANKIIKPEETVKQVQDRRTEDLVKNLPDPASFPEPSSTLSKPLPVQFSPSARNIVSSGRATSTLRARSAYTARRHPTAASTSRSGSKFSVRPEDADEEDEDEDEESNSDYAREAGSRAHSPVEQTPPPTITADDLFSKKQGAGTKSNPSPQKSASAGRQILGFLDVAGTSRPRASSPLKSAITASPDRNETQPASIAAQMANHAGSFGNKSTETSNSSAPAGFSFKQSTTAKTPSFTISAPSPSASSAATGKKDVPAMPAFSFGPPKTAEKTKETDTTTQNFFGKPATENGMDGKPVDASAPANSTNPLLARMGQVPTSSVAPPSATFSFSRPAASSPAPAAPAFNLSSSSGTLASSSKPFTFGAPAANAAPQPASAEAPKDNFQFGKSSAPAAIGSVSKPESFNFGAPPAAEGGKPAPAPFSFGAPPSAPSVEAPKQAKSANGGFTFNAGATSQAAEKSSAPPTFSFGAAPSTATPVTQAPAFNFGAPAGGATTPTFAPAHNPFGSATGISAPKPTPAPFNFGTGPITPTPLSSPGLNTGSSGFSFGAPSQPANTPNASSNFNFGSSAPPTNNVAGPSFAFGATSTGFSAPAPTPHGSSGYGFGAPAAAPPAPSFGAIQNSNQARESATPPPMFALGANNPIAGSPGSGRDVRALPRRRGTKRA